MAKELRPILPAEVWLTIDEGSGKVTVKTNLECGNHVNTVMTTESSDLTIANHSALETERIPVPPCISLQQAARDNSIEIVDDWIAYLSTKSECVRNDTLNEKDEHGMAAIHYAAKFNHFVILVKLCENGADTTLTTTEEGFTPLHYASYYIPPCQLNAEQLERIKAHDHLTSSKKAVDLLTGLPQTDVNVGDKYKVTPLHLACRRGNLDAAEVLLSHSDIHPMIKDEHDDTPLHEACLHGNDAIVEMLFNTNAYCDFCDSGTKNKDHQTPLHLTCQEGHIRLVKKLLAKCPPGKRKGLLDAHDVRGNTPFHLAVRSVGLANKRETEIVSVLLDHGANPGVERKRNTTDEGNTTDDSEGNVTGIYDRITPLHIAARYDLVDVIEILLSQDQVVPDVVDVNQQTPLHFAAMNNRPDAVNALIRRGAKTGMKDINSCTPFLLAAANGHSEVIRQFDENKELTNLDKNRRSAVFLAAEGDHLSLLKDLIKISERTSIKMLCTPDVHLNTPLHIAAKLGHLSIVEELLREELVLSGQVKLDAKNESKKTPTHLAAENGHVKVLKRLTARSSALVLHVDENGNTPLHLAARNGWKHSVKLLIEKRASVDTRNDYLATALSLAAGSGHLQCVKMLLHFKAEIDSRDRNQATPLHYAVTRDRLAVVKVLISCGAKCALKDKDGCNALDLAIKHGHEDIAREIVLSDQWEEALKNLTLKDGPGVNGKKDEYTTPFRRMIIKMPDVARLVLNRCTTYHKEGDGVKLTKYNYRYIEDFREPIQDKPTWADKVPFKWAKRLYLRWITRHFRAEKDNSNNWGPEKFNRATHPLTIMAESNDTKLISHPLVVNLLMFKLRKYGTVYYIIHLALHLLMLFFLTLFTFLVYNPKSDVCEVVFSGKFGILENASDICNSFNHNGEQLSNSTLQALCGSCGSDPHHLRLVSWTAKISFAIIIIRILLFIFISSIKQKIDFVKSIRNWIEIPMFACSIIFVIVFGTTCNCPTPWQWQIGTAAILLVWIDLINLIRKLQMFDIGIYILMFENILVTFFHTALLSALLLVAFSLAFHMAFYQPGMDFTPLSHPGQAILTVLTYVTGGADYNGLFSLSHENISREEHLEIPYLTISILLWVTFLIIMIILLANMLIGLAVDDIQGIKKAAEVQRLKLLVDLTLTVDSALFYRHLFIVQEHKVKNRQFSLWKTCNAFLWKGQIVQDTPDKIAQAMENDCEPSIEQVHAHTHSLVKELVSLKETMKALNDRNRRMELAITQVSTVLAAQFNYSPNPELEFRSLSYPGQ